MKRNRRQTSREAPVGWLPVDSRLVLPIFAFGHVHGVAKVFLTIEMVLAVGVVAGSFGMVLIHLMP